MYNNMGQSISKYDRVVFVKYTPATSMGNIFKYPINSLAL